MLRNIFALPLASLVALTSCGTKEVGESPVRDIDGVILLDNAEEGLGQLPLADEEAPAGFSSYGFWYTYHDVGTCEDDGLLVTDMGGAVTPEQGADFTVTPYAAEPTVNPHPETLPNERTNENALRITGANHTYFGAGLGFKFDNAYAGTAPGVNLTAAGIVGIRFWATTTSPASYIVKMHDKYSTPEADLCDPRKPPPGCEGAQNCENAPTVTVGVTNAWQLYEVYFTAEVEDDPATPEFEIGPMVRGDWGGITTIDGATTIGPNLPPEPSAVYQLQFQTSDGSLPFDLWVDNFGFILAGGAADDSAGVAPAPADTMSDTTAQ